MKLGTLTVALGDLPFDQACKFLAERGVQMVEIGCGGFPGKAHCDAAELLAATFHELREGVSAKGQRIEKPSAVMSTAEAISVYFQTLMTAWYYGDGSMDERVLVDNLVGAVAKESQEDLGKINSYFSTVVRDRAKQEGGAWTRYYEARTRLK